MARFIIFVGVLLLLLLVGLIIWWIGNKIYISIRRQQKQFSIEETGYDQAKVKIKESFKEDKEWREKLF